MELRKLRGCRCAGFAISSAQARMTAATLTIVYPTKERPFLQAPRTILGALLNGERTPHLDPNVRAALVGLSPSHTRAHIIRAIQEGVAFSLKDTFSILRR